jgi:hypothetical protein
MLFHRRRRRRRKCSSSSSSWVKNGRHSGSKDTLQRPEQEIRGGLDIIN